MKAPPLAAGIFYYDLSFFRSLDRIVQNEPWIERDRAMIDPLRSIGIEKGKPFAPNAATQAILIAAIGEAKALLEQRYDAGFPPFWERSRWTLPAPPEAIDGQGTTYAKHDSYALDARGVAYTYAYIAIKRLGAGQFYLISIRDKDGNPYDGGKAYRLSVPPNVPIEQYWSVTAYDRQTHALIRNMARAEPLLADSRDAEERRWLDRRLFRPRGAEGQGVELGADGFKARLRADVPPLCADKGVLRQGLGAARRRTDRGAVKRDAMSLTTMSLTGEAA